MQQEVLFFEGESIIHIIWSGVRDLHGVDRGCAEMCRVFF
jgi:hypothetical protein